ALASVDPGLHKLSTVAYDPHGNHTETASVDFRIDPFVDREAPKPTITLTGTPDAQTVAAGSTIPLTLPPTPARGVAAAPPPRCWPTGSRSPSSSPSPTARWA